MDEEKKIPARATRSSAAGSVVPGTSNPESLLRTGQQGAGSSSTMPGQPIVPSAAPTLLEAPSGGTPTEEHAGGSLGEAASSSAQVPSVPPGPPGLPVEMPAVPNPGRTSETPGLNLKATGDTGLLPNPGHQVPPAGILTTSAPTFEATPVAASAAFPNVPPVPLQSGLPVVAGQPSLAVAGIRSFKHSGRHRSCGVAPR